MSYIIAYHLSAVFYLFILLITCLLSNYADKFNKKTVIWFIIIILTVIAGFRDYRVGIDTETYINYVQDMTTRSDFEILFRLFAGISRLFKMDRLILILMATFTYGFFFMRMWEMRKRISLPWAVFVFITLFYFETFNIMRQMFAMSVVFYGTRWLEKHEYGKYILCVAFASTMHLTAVIAIISVYFDSITWKSMPKRFVKLIALYFIGTPLIFLAGMYFFITSGLYYTVESKFNYFFNSQFNISEGGIGLMQFAKIILIIMIIAPYLMRRVKVNLKIAGESVIDECDTADNSFAYWLLTIVVGVALSFVGYKYSNMDRLAFYYTMLQIPLYSLILSKGKSRWLSKPVILVICVYTYYSYINNSISNCMPYFY